MKLGKAGLLIGDSLLPKLRPPLSLKVHSRLVRQWDLLLVVMHDLGILKAGMLSLELVVAAVLVRDVQLAAPVAYRALLP